MFWGNQMSHDLDQNIELASGLAGWDFNNSASDQTGHHVQTAVAEHFELIPLQNTETAFALVTNDEFLTSIFGNTFGREHPLICKKSGDPDLGGWTPTSWPCSTSNQDQNWYFLPGLYQPDDAGNFRAKKEFATALYVAMVDDIGTKVSADRFINFPPSWSVETSPGNFQYGFIFSNPVTDLAAADRLKEKLITAGLCDSGATGGSVRWMRLPRAINGRSKYGYPSPNCRLDQWQPNFRYSIQELESKLALNHVGINSQPSIPTRTNENHQQHSDNQVIEALKLKGLYKQPNGSGKHNITCPWVGQHTDAIDNGSAYFEPSEEFPSGGFKCHHSHGNLFHIRELLSFLNLNEPQVNAGSIKGIEVIFPSKLPPVLRAVPALDPDHLPASIKGAVIDLADRLQCPMDYLAVAMLSAAGAVVGNKVGIFPYANDESWEVFPALWGGVVGDPGSKKTPSLQAAHKPLQHLENTASQNYAQARQVYELAVTQFDKDLAAWNQSKTQSMKPTAPVEPKRERYVVHDSTYQALGVILSENPRGVLALADELSGLLQSLDTPGQEAARGFYLTGWSGTGGYSFDRIGRGSITLDRFCISVFGGFQPDRIKAYVQFSQRGSTKNDGLLQRFQLLVWPDHIGTFQMVDRLPNQSAIDVYHKAILGLSSTVQSRIAGTIQRPNGSQLLHFDSKAQQLFSAWFMKNERMLANGSLDPARQSHFAKYRSLVPALALLFHLLDGHDGPVCEDCLHKTILFAKYLKKHADRIYASVSGHDHAAVRVLAERLLEEKLSDGFTCKTLTLKGWAGLSTKEQAQAAIDALVEYKWLTEIEHRAGGRPTFKYYLNQHVSQDLL